MYSSHPRLSRAVGLIRKFHFFVRLPSLQTAFTMGRRAKNKQGDPEALREPVEHASPKGLGKRKAGTVIVRQQPAKKIKNAVKSTQKHTKSANSIDTLEYKKGLQGDDSWNGIEEESDGNGDGAGWEDIRDEDILPTQTRCVSSHASPAATYLTKSNTTDHYFRIATFPRVTAQTRTSIQTRTRMYLSRRRILQLGLVHSTPGLCEKLSLTQKNFK